MNQYKKITMLVDELTGEIIAEDSKGYRIPIFVKFKERHRFSKTYHIDMVEFENKTYYKYFYVCICSLEMGTNRVVAHSKELYGGTSLSIKDIAKASNTTERTIYSFMDYCMKHKIIRRMDLDGEFFGFFVNPRYVFNGENIQPILYIMFKGYGIEEYINKSGAKLMDEYCNSFELKEIIKNTYKTYRALSN